MKKSIMFLSAIVISAFILFGFQNSDFNNTLDDKVIIIENQDLSNNSSSYILTNNLFGESKCGAGKCGGDKAKAEKKVVKEVKEVIEKKCGGDIKKANCNTPKTKKACCSGPKDEKYGFMNNDTDKDGKVSKAEFNKKHEEMFSTMDKNADGFISTDEAEEMHKANCDVKEAKPAKAIKATKVNKDNCGSKKDNFV